jgi:hypothetical protein
MNFNNLPRENYANLPEEKMASNVVLFFLQTAKPFRGILRQKLQQKLMLSNQGFGSGSGLDPDSIGPVDPESESGSGSRRAKMTHKSRKKFVEVHVLKCWMASFES